MTAFATYSLQDLQLQRSMCADAIDFVREDGREPEAKMFELLADYDRQLAMMTGRVQLNDNPVIDDGVRETVRDSLGRERAAYGQGGAHRATDKQVNFLRKLIDTKDHGSVKVPASVEGIGKKACSALIDQLIDRPAKASAATVSSNGASDKQLDLIKRLLGEKDLTGLTVPAELATLTGGKGGTASKLIDSLFAAPRKPRQAVETVELASGIYALGEQVYKVYQGQSGRMLAKLLVVHGEGDAEFVYQGLAARFVPADATAMTLEQAKAFGAIYGVCCNCGRTLTDEGSIEAGIGPVCAKKFA